MQRGPGGQINSLFKNPKTPDSNISRAPIGANGSQAHLQPGESDSKLSQFRPKLDPSHPDYQTDGAGAHLKTHIKQ